MNMHHAEHLIVGMPAGSLADPSRGGNLVRLLADAGFKATGYDQGGPTRFASHQFLFGWDGRPQEFGAQMALQELDVAIAGDDWIKERLLELQIEYQQTVELKKILSLNRGAVKIVAICKKNPAFADIHAILRSLAASTPLVTVVSEMPYLALEWIKGLLQKNGLADAYKNFSVQKYKTPPKIQQGILIYETWGKTEAKVKNDGAHFGIEITQTGSAIRNYDLQVVDQIMASETGIWINPAIKGHAVKTDLLKMFLLNLYGSINAENKVLVVFNVSKEYRSDIENYLSKNNLYADEPTINMGQNFVEYSIQIDTHDQTTPLAQVRYQLAKLKAMNIDTIPINSSIPSIDIIKF